ncbi:MAG: phosphoglucomutase/phosphomannomutase family protein [Bacteroidetes bacterium]|nr:phosphoglucomutase/phosphomannomutase family protein [Bacteroidota bacterium]
MTPIKFGTDGWRAIIAKEFTVENVARVAEATAIWLLKQNKSPKVMVGYDTRFAGQMFAQTYAAVLASHNIKVILSDNFVSTPMLSFATAETGASLGIIITASHNPPSYNGIKLKGSYGGPLLPEKVEEVEKLIPSKFSGEIEKLDFEQFLQSGKIELMDMESIYLKKIEQSFDIAAIRNSGLKLGFDAMYGAGLGVLQKLFPEITQIHCDYNPSFMGQAPEPIEKNLGEFRKLIIENNLDSGIAVDGDADRIGLFDNNGHYVDSHHLILLLIHYLHKYKGMDGKVCVAFSTTSRIAKMCSHYGLPVEISKIGFKYICQTMISEDVMLGGEESGGIAIKGHIPERDGIWIGLTIWEYMAKSGKTLQQLIDEVYEITGKFGLERSDLHLKEEVKDLIVENCKNGKYQSFGKYIVQRIDNLDGYKYFFNDDEWIMIRPSGTEPVLRAYAESYSKEQAEAILEAGKETFLNQ